VAVMESMIVNDAARTLLVARGEIMPTMRYDFEMEAGTTL
jgi:hypothetical protein